MGILGVYRMSMTVLKNEVSMLRTFAKGDVLVTNLKSKTQKNYYCLMINQDKIQILERDGDTKSKTVFDLETNKIFLNNQEMKEYTAEFSKKIKSIVEDFRLGKTLFSGCK